MEYEFFKPHEFFCRCGKCEYDREGGGMASMSETLLAMLDLLREKVGEPLVINSSIRCEAYNATLENSSLNSSHLKGLAVDIACDCGTLRFKLVKYGFQVGFRRIEVGPTWVHLDIDPDKPQDVLWLDKKR